MGVNLVFEAYIFTPSVSRLLGTRYLSIYRCIIRSDRQPVNRAVYTLLIQHPDLMMILDSYCVAGTAHVQIL